MALRRASGRSASTSSCSSVLRKPLARGRRLNAAEEEEAFGITYSDEVLAPGDVDEDEDEEEEEEAIDWWAFWQDVDEGEAADEDLDDTHDMLEAPTAQEKIEDMLARLPALRQRDDFTSIMPVPTIKEYAPVLPQAEEAPRNPDWNAWDYRAYVEKERRKARENAGWQKRMAAVGRFQYLNVTRNNDLRLIDPHDPPREWTDEEVWQFITMDGTAADPREVTIKVEDPRGRHDILETGGKYIESTEDHLRRTGHWLENEPPEEAADTSLTQLAADFADFEEPGTGPSSAGGIDEGGAASPAALGPDVGQGEELQQDPSFADDD